MKLIPIRPQGELFNIAAVARAITGALAETAADAQRDLQSTTATWERTVDFTITPIPDGFRVDTADPIWHYVDEGTRPHVIVPRRAKVLMFGPGGQPKTAVRVIGSGTGTKGGPAVVAHRVNHPGTAAREFSQALQEKYDADLPQRIDAALGEALDKR